ncbi:hypothetical protein G3O08_17670 [Cryomorpha ignava]|uniref:Type II secretion system protein GspG C-terminal domain-containing protein n=1 Tax=Cryomorpha ignava TaxID=101383 RepID=A0A7K3WUH3_9FLAO|nr:type II secretion system protein GspG [Cryomorpha ignava]NEN25329.1 hypothetical protein [Cryomorpha ignava]
MIVNVVSLLVAPFILLFLAFEGYSILNDNVLAEDRTIKEMTTIEEKIIEYELNYGRYPNSLDVLISIRPIREGWKRDYWNEEYLYSANDSEFVLISQGRDRKHYTDDDIKRVVKISN